ncbi:Por secretion system C-terminal sorting domain-containing protein [Pustulibacterium marinum]|uniref:Por secretion system C-terminal sorting domain-containing protein n=1 Tax=Pustulibacterium marinum TaxID=1224947 RepID=A0A1I7EYA5_9FLAO|nr:lamin tail domain-containing protein [Pustulibacterium marinum]SFU28896.1 Por secretion system C-terminal sorting domain-containing protein [Pustulibacterium marinum]
MKKIYFLIFSLLMSGIALGQNASDLYFSMYAEGSSNNKFLEIYNGTGADVDLSGYSISTCSNGCDEISQFDYPNNVSFDAGTILAAGDVYVIAHPSADASILAVADETFTHLSNGDDTIALTISGATADTYTIVDIIGDLGGDVGSGWDVAGISAATQNHTLTRKTSVCGPNATELGSFGTDAETSEWIVTDIDTEWANLGSYTGCSTSPVLTITAPLDGEEFESGTALVTVSVSTQNFDVAAVGAGDGHIHWMVNGVAQPMKYDLNDETISTVDGESYTVYMELVDDSHTAISPAVNQTITFSVANPCDLSLGTETATCDASTSEIDTYTATIDFTGGGSSTYTITVNDGIVGGDDPSTNADGTIIITDIAEGTNLTVSILGDSSDSSCDFSTYIESPVCLGDVTCANAGDVIITEIMQNPSAVYDNEGEWFELYNTTSSDINMQGWVIKDEASEGEEFTISALTIPANGYVVLGTNADVTTNGNVTVDYEYGSAISLGNGTDGIIIECTETVIDQVTWDNGDTFPDPNGASMELATNAYDATSNDDGANWAEATSTYGDGDLGTPGLENDNTMSTDKFANASFSMYPNPVTNGTLNIVSNQDGEMNVQIFNLLGKQVLNTMTTETINVSALKRGVYLAKVTQNGVSSTQKLVIK